MRSLIKNSTIFLHSKLWLMKRTKKTFYSKDLLKFKWCFFQPILVWFIVMNNSIYYFIWFQHFFATVVTFFMAQNTLSSKVVVWICFTTYNTFEPVVIFWLFIAECFLQFISDFPHGVFKPAFQAILFICTSALRFKWEMLTAKCWKAMSSGHFPLKVHLLQLKYFCNCTQQGNNVEKKRKLSLNRHKDCNRNIFYACCIKCKHTKTVKGEGSKC